MQALGGIQAKILKVWCIYEIKLALYVTSMFFPFIHKNLTDEWLQHQNSVSWDLPRAPVAKTLSSQRRGPGFDPWSEN